jgi:hypothetical protein
MFDPSALFQAGAKAFEAYDRDANPFTIIFVLVVGIVSLFYGRKAFWLAAGLVGFFLGLLILPWFVGPLPPSMQGGLVLGLSVATALGFAIATRVIAIPIAFVAFGLIGNAIAVAIHASPWMQWSALVVAGALGALFTYRFHDVALVLISAFFGTAAIYTAMVLADVERNPTTVRMLVVGSVVAGIGFQAWELWRERMHPFVIPAAAGGVPKKPKPSK